MFLRVILKSFQFEVIVDYHFMCKHHVANDCFKTILMIRPSYRLHLVFLIKPAQFSSFCHLVLPFTCCFHKRELYFNLSSLSAHQSSKTLNLCLISSRSFCFEFYLFVKPQCFRSAARSRACHMALYVIAGCSMVCLSTTCPFSF